MIINNILTPTKLLNPINCNITKRTMLRGVSQIITKPCKIVQPTPFNHTIKRNIPDQGYRGFKINCNVTGKNIKTGNNNYETQAVGATGKELPLHEKSHYLIKDNETGKIVAILTSAKDPTKGNEYLASENVKNNILPNGASKPQMIRALNEPRFYLNNSEIIEDVVATTFLKKYEKEINDFVKRTGTHKKIAIYRVTKNSPILYHQDGRPIFNEYGNEINYDN